MGKNDRSAHNGNLILVLVAMVMGIMIGLMLASHTNNGQEGTLQGKVDEVLNLVNDEYVDLVNVDSLSESILAVILEELDPHSTYLSARETAHTEEMMRGSFEGIGIVLHHEEDTSFIGQVLADGPSAQTGILPGDVILTVDGEAVSGVGMPSDSVVARLRGPRGTKVTVEVLREGVLKKSYTIRRGVVSHTTVACAKMLDDTVGYILLSNFSSTSHDEFRAALERMKRQGMRRLIFDLRGNGGGSLQSAVGIADELLPAGSLIVYTQGEHSRRHNVVSHIGGLFPQGSLIVLVDEYSASASEVVSGALQDNDRALIVGRRTFGKGLVQGEFTLKDGSSVLLTTARYYTPSGRCIQRPYGDGTDKYYRDYFEQLIDETYSDTMTIHIADSTPYSTVGGRIVYGGGGIVPDLLLPYRKDKSFIYYNSLANKGLIAKVAFRYVRRHAARLLEQYPTPEAFGRGFFVDDEMIEELVADGERAGVVRDTKSLAVQSKLITSMIKAHIGMALYGNEAFYDAYLPMDDDLNRVKNVRIEL